MRIIVAVLLLFTLLGCGPSARSKKTLDNIPAALLGNFTDDYGIRYTVSKELWTQHPGSKYHLLSYNSKEKYFIARNDAANKTDGGLFTRIDITHFENMAPWEWGFCLTVYNAKTAEEAAAAVAADRLNPRKGCGGYPFSRMKKSE